MSDRSFEDVFLALDKNWRVRPDAEGRRIWKSVLANHPVDEVVDAVLTWQGTNPPRPSEVRTAILGSGGRVRAFVWGVPNIERIIALGDEAYTERFFARARAGLQVLSPAARRRWASRLSREIGAGEAA